MTNIKLSDVKRAYAQKALAIAKGKGIKGSVVVLPEFMEENGTWVPTDSAVIESANSTKGFGYIGLVQNRTVMVKGAEFDNDVWAIQRGKVASMEAKYTPGMVLEGHIVTEDTLTAPNPSNVAQDLKYISAAAREANIPCTIDDQPIYQIRYWDNTGTIADTHIPHNNVIEVVAKNTGMKAAQAKRLAELQGKATKTKAEKLEIAELEDAVGA